MFLIADVRGYTSFTQERGDDAGARLAERFARIARDAVERGGGSLVELRGDEALAIFRSPRQAIGAAVALQKDLLEQTLADPDIPLPVGIGLDVGEAVPVEGGYRGGVLNLAARLSAASGPGEILASSSLVHLARTIEGIRYVDRGELRLKGLADPVSVIEISAEGTDVPKQMTALAPRRRRRPTYGGTKQFRVLGPLEVVGGSGPLRLGGPKQRLVLAHLLMRPNELVPVETLVEGIWGEDSPEKARSIVQTYVSNLRRMLGRDRIEGYGPGYRLRVAPAEVDADRFDALVREAQRTLPVDPSLATGLLDDALALWRGPALADLAQQPSLLAESARLDDLRIEAQEGRIEAILATGAPARAIGELEVMIRRHPLRESLWGLLMLALYRMGRQGEALAAYQRARLTLAEELGIDPSPELSRLQQRVLRQDPSLELRGEPLRGYRLLEKIGEGPTGAVFRAIQPRVERDVAVKIFDKDVAADPAFVRRFEHEAQAAAALEHAHLCPIYDYWREPGRAYIVSRYLRGGSLRARVERGDSLDQDDALRLIEQVASALSFAHRQGLAHGNVRPSNILFDNDGNAHLGDFHIGVGVAPEATTDVSELGELVRTLFPHDVPSRLESLVERAETGEAITAEALAMAARTAYQPTSFEVAKPADERNPYKGLRAFRESDARDFFGRSAFVSRLIDRLGEDQPASRFLAVVGPSGCGKSSVVRAGVIPTIRRGEGLDQPLIAEMFPGAHPLEELEAALLRTAAEPVPRLRELLASSSRGLLSAVEAIASGRGEVILVVDQFEEVFTVTADDRERERFLESLRVACADPESRLRVIVTLRADFYDRPLIYPRFGDLLAARSEAVPPLSTDEVEEAIRRPAEQVGVTPEPGLVAEMIADVAHQPGALPLLQFALTELFDHRSDERLTLAAYEQIGGIAGALSASADRIWEGADRSARGCITQVFLRLVSLGEGRRDTRRRVTRTELDELGFEEAAVDRVLDAFGRHRLLTFDRDPSTREPTVEIAHEAMLADWTRLSGWIDDAREDLREAGRLTRAAAEWRASDRDPSFLLRGARLEQADAWLRTTGLAVGPNERAYVKAGVDLGDRESEKERKRRAHEASLERRSRTRLRALVAVLTVAALVASGLTLIATSQSERAGREADRATRAAAIASARELAADAIANLEADPARSILLAIESVDRTRSIDGSVLPEAEEALHRAIGTSRLVLSVRGAGGLLAWSPAGVFVTEGASGSGLIEIRDSETGELVIPRFEGHQGDINDVAFSPDGSRLATAGADGTLKVWDPATGELVASWSGRGEVWGPSFNDDGTRVAAAWNDEVVRVLEVRTGDEVSSVGVEFARDTALSPNGNRVAAMTYFGRVAAYVLDLRTEGVTLRLDAANCCPIPQSRGIAWSPDGRFIATTNGGAALVWDAASGRRRDTLLGHTGAVLAVAWSPDSSRLVTGGSDGTAKVWGFGPDSPGELWSLSSQEMKSGVVGVAFSPDGTKVMAGDKTITAANVWDIGATGDAEWSNLPSAGGAFVDVAFTPDGRSVLVEGESRQVIDFEERASSGLAIWDARTGRRMSELGPAPDAFHFSSFDVSPDGSTVALGGGKGGCCNGRVRVWDMRTGEELVKIVYHLDVQDVAFSPDGDYIVSAGWDPGARVVDSEGHLVATLPEADGFVFERARFSPDGRLVAAAAADRYESETGRVRIWNWANERVLRTIRVDAVSSLDFHPDRVRIAIAGYEGVAGIWDVASGDPIVRLEGRSGGVNDIAFSPDGAVVATAGFDGTVRIFDATTGSTRIVLRGHSCGVARLDFSPDGSKLASVAACDGTRIWAIDIDDLLEIARREVMPALTDDQCRRLLKLDACE